MQDAKINNDFESDIKWFDFQLKNKKLVSVLSTIKLVISDIDGTLTDGTVYLTGSKQSKELKGVSMHDNFGMEQLIKEKFHLAFVSGRFSDPFKYYAKSLGVPKNLYFENQSKNKEAIVLKVQKQLKLSIKDTLYFGDDMIDLRARSACSLFVCPSNSPFYIQEEADLVVPKSGGHGAMRLLIDLLLYIQKKHFAQDVIEDSLQRYKESKAL